MGRTFDPKHETRQEPLFYNSSVHGSQVHADALGRKLLTYGIVAAVLTAGALSIKPVRDIGHVISDKLKAAVTFTPGP